MTLGRCTACGGRLARHAEPKDGQDIEGTRCVKCGEVLFTFSELLRWEVLTGKRKPDVRRVRRVGGSLVVTIPDRIAEDLVHERDLALFRKEKGRLVLDIVHVE